MESSSLNEYNNDLCSVTNWLNTTINEWMITPKTEYRNVVCHVVHTGEVHNGNVIHGYWPRPVIFTKTNIKITSGTGTKENPYFLSL